MSKESAIVDPLTLPDDKAREKAGFRLHYGVWWPPVGKRPVAEIEVELELFKLPKSERPKDSPGRYHHLKRIIDIIWNAPNSPAKYEHHPWSERVLQAFCKHKEVAIAGCAGSGKTQAMAIWCIVSFLANPSKVHCLVTSTSKQDSKKRVWGDIETYWNAAAYVVGVNNLPGKLLPSETMIARKDVLSGKLDRRHGISLIAAEPSKAAEAQTKMQGVHADHVILAADELEELSESVIKTANTNLRNNPMFQLISAANPKSYYSPFAATAEPADGWDSINETMDGWKTKRGICVRLDGERSPNIVAGKTLYPYLLTQERLNQYKHDLGEKSAGYYQMVRGWWSPTGALDAIYSEADIIRMKANKPAVWREPPTLVAGIDPSYTNGGDRTVIVFGKLGYTTENMQTLEYTEVVPVFDETNKQEGRAFRIATKIANECKKRGVLPQHVAVDVTGAGGPFCDILRNIWAGGFLEINFAGAASKLPASGTDSTPSNERYVNHVSEIWFVGREFIQSNQIRGMLPEMVKELCARTYEIKTQGRVEVERKKTMKGRTGFSPDIGDASMLTLAVCRHRLGFGSKLRSKSSGNPKQQRREPWKLTGGAKSKYHVRAQKIALAKNY